MPDFVGQYNCKLDSKGRLQFPARFIKQMPPDGGGLLYINRGVEKCLSIYSLSGWNKFKQKLNSLNVYDRKKRRLVRFLMQGSAEITLDSSNRILIPKDLVTLANLGKEVVLQGCLDKIELWDKQAYEEEMAQSDDLLLDLTDEILGNEEMGDLMDEMLGGD